MVIATESQHKGAVRSQQQHIQYAHLKNILFIVEISSLLN